MNPSLSKTECQDISSLCQEEGITTLARFFKERNIPFPAGLLIPLIDVHGEASLKNVQEWFGGSDANARGITKNLAPYVKGPYSLKSITDEGTKLAAELSEAFGTKVHEVLDTRSEEEVTEILPAIYQGLLEIHKQRMKTKVGKSGRKAESPLLKWLQLSLFNEKGFSQRKFGNICGVSDVTAHKKIHTWKQAELINYSRVGQKTTITTKGKYIITLQRIRLTKILMDSEAGTESL